jgi:uncharacterized tellurite resistance protein B-like protein
MIKTEDNLRYSACLLACAVAAADGKLQDEEKHELQTIINQELVLNSKSFMYAGVLGNLIRHGETLKANHTWALSELKKYEKQISPELKQQIMRMLKRVAEAFPAASPEEDELMKQIQQGIEALGMPQA